jgi:hypothetical protein
MLLPLLSALAFGGCDGTTEPGEGAVELRLFSDSIMVGQSARVAGVGDTALHLIGGGRWSSSNPAVAAVDGQGIITGKKAGTARISLGVGAVTRLGQVTVTVLDPLPDAQAYAYASVEGRATTCEMAECGGLGTMPSGPWVRAPVRISCGPGLFGARTLTDADGRFRFDLRVPAEVRSELIDGDKLGCLLQIDPFWGKGRFCLTEEGCHASSHRVAVPIITFVTDENAVVSYRADIIETWGGWHPITALQELLYTISVGGSVTVPVRTPRSTCFRAVGVSAFPEHAKMSRGLPWETITVLGTAPGTATIQMFVVNQCNQSPPDTVAIGGAIGVRVMP